MNRIINVKLLLILIIVVTSFSLTNMSLQESRKNLGARYSVKISPVSSQVIKMLAGEFNGLFADYILLNIASFNGSSHHVISKNEWDKIYLGFMQIMELDPYFEQSYLLAQSILAWEAKKPHQAIDILEKSRNKRLWDFRPGFYQGFDYYYFLGDYKNAASVFTEVAKMKDPPLLVVLLASRFAVKEHQTSTSLQMLFQINKNPDLDEKYKKEIEDRILALQGVLIIEKAINIYKKKYGELPDSLDKLITKKLLSGLPENPYHTSYRYNKEENRVFFDLAKDNTEAK